jgi:hypothetical protein
MRARQISGRTASPDIALRSHADSEGVRPHLIAWAAIESAGSWVETGLPPVDLEDDERAWLWTWWRLRLDQAESQVYLAIREAAAMHWILGGRRRITPPAVARWILAAGARRIEDYLDPGADSPACGWCGGPISEQRLSRARTEETAGTCSDRCRHALWHARYRSRDRSH